MLILTCICLVQKLNVNRLAGNPDQCRKMSPVPVVEKRKHLQILDINVLEHFISEDVFICIRAYYESCKRLNGSVRGRF